MPMNDFFADPSQELPTEQDVIKVKVTIADGFTDFDMFDCPKLEAAVTPLPC